MDQTHVTLVIQDPLVKGESAHRQELILSTFLGSFYTYLNERLDDCDPVYW